MVAAPSEQLQPTERPGFPTLEEFERIAERARQRVYRRSAVRNVALTVETGVPDVDEGGQPLLGSYTPPGEDPTQHPPEIRLYYRAFQTEFRLDSGFDVAAEIHETIAHEVEHHLYFLAGDDPMDAEERLAIAQERAEIVGKQELLRRGVRDAWAELRGFVRVALPLLLLLLGLLLLQELTR